MPGSMGALASSRPAVLQALHLNEELDPVVSLHVNLAKCELYSRKGNTSCPPNLDILGALIARITGTVYCRQVC